MTNKIIGKQGEELAKNFLIKKGFTIVEMNYRFSRVAEIDIIAQKDNVLHFVEVKTRTQNFFGSPLEAINKAKLTSIYKCANYYLFNSKKRFKKIQIDAIGIILNKNGEHKFDFVENISLN